MRLAAVLLFGCMLGANSPSPLLTGSVRDQYGDPIAGADVSALGRHTLTDETGTFALPVAGAHSVTIACAYCATLVIPVRPNSAVVAIVRRYSALSQSAPTERDLAAVPYAHAESVLSLVPFIVLSAGSRGIPGGRVSDHGASPQGSLLIDDGITNYDITSNASPFAVFPSYAANQAQMRGPADAFLYGDQASGGIASVQTRPASGSSGEALAGSSAAFGLAQNNDRYSAFAGAANDAGDRRQRIDASFMQAGGSDSLTATTIASHEDSVSDAGFSTGFTGIRFDYDLQRAVRTHASFTADRAGYDANNAPVDAAWSDVDARFGVVTNARVRTFFDAGYRLSNGFYEAFYAGIPRVAGTIATASADAGAIVQSDRYALRAGAGIFSISYDGGAYGYRIPLSATIFVPSLSASYALGSQWNVSVDAAGSFRLPTLVQAYASREPSPDNALPVDRNAALIATILYSDLRRFRAGATLLDQHTSGAHNGSRDGIGALLGWQIAPLLALRTWIYRFEESTPAFGPQPAGFPRPVTAASVWLTYENVGGLRADALYRQDLLDFSADPHVDASVSGPASPALRWFVSTEKWRGQRSFSAGLRAASP